MTYAERERLLQGLLGFLRSDARRREHVPIPQTPAAERFECQLRMWQLALLATGFDDYPEPLAAKQVPCKEVQSRKSKVKGRKSD